MTFADLIESLQMHPKYPNGIKVPMNDNSESLQDAATRVHSNMKGYKPQMTMTPVAPLTNYVPEWKRNKMAEEAKWQQYTERLKAGSLGQ